MYGCMHVHVYLFVSLCMKGDRERSVHMVVSSFVFAYPHIYACGCCSFFVSLLTEKNEGNTIYFPLSPPASQLSMLLNVTLCQKKEYCHCKHFLVSVMHVITAKAAFFFFF